MNRLFGAVVVSGALLVAQPSHAQGYWGGSEAWRFGSSGGFSQNIQSGQGGFGGNFGFNRSFDFLGCSFSLSQFIQSNFNLPTNFEEIQQALQTRLVKYAITNFSIMPQLQAAIQDFQAKLGIDLRMARESCNLNSLGQEQRRTLMQTCTQQYGGAEQTADFLKCIEGKGKVGTDALVDTRRQIDQMTQSLCRSVTETARGLFCQGQGQCGTMALLPQMRLTCNGQGQVIGGETQAATLGVGTVGQGFAALGNMAMRTTYNIIDGLRAQGLTDDQLTLVQNAAMQEAAAGAAAASTAPSTASTELRYIDLTGTQFANAAGSASKNAKDGLDADNAKRKRGCKVDDALAMGKYIARAANRLGFTATEPQVDDAQRQQIAQQILAGLAAGADSISSGQRADATEVLKAIEVVSACGLNMEGGVDIPTYFALARLPADVRESYLAAKAVEMSCSHGDFLLDLAEDQAEAAVVKAKATDKTPLNPNAVNEAGAPTDMAKPTTAGIEKVQAYAEFSRETLQDARKTLASICKARRESAPLDATIRKIEQGVDI